MKIPDADLMIAEAERTTCLSDWGGDDFKTPFKILVSAINDEADLHELGAARTRQWLQLRLEQRLKLFEDRKRDPRVAEQEVEKPVFVAGLPRAGTTFLHALLASDKNNIAPKHWQMLVPSPPPNDPAIDHASTIERMTRMFELQGWLEPHIRAMHEYSPFAAEECSTAFELSFVNTNFLGYWPIQSYMQVLAGDFMPAYTMHKKVLQALQVGTTGRRWVLKAPEHTTHLDTLLKVYPDASIVQHHRDPAKVMASTLSVLAGHYPLYSQRTVKPDRQAALYLVSLYASGLERIIELRRDPDVNRRFVDVSYLDMERDPLGVVQRVYGHADMKFDAAARSGMKEWMSHNRKGKHGKHSYDLSDYGVTREEVWEMFSAYIRYFDVEIEKKS